MKGQIYYLSLASFFLFLCLTLSSCQKAPDPITKTSFKLNTVITITIYDSEDTSLLDEAVSLCDLYENLFSRTRETSELYRINEGLQQELSPDTESLLETALGRSPGSQHRSCLLPVGLSRRRARCSGVGADSVCAPSGRL